MRKIKIVADSSCDLFGLERADFAVAPMKIITAEREFVDDALDVNGIGAKTKLLMTLLKKSQPQILMIRGCDFLQWISERSVLVNSYLYDVRA